MNNNQGSGGGILWYLLLMFAAAYAAIEVVKAVVAAITALLMGLVNICLVVSGILAVYWVYRYISDQQFGETKNLQQIEKLERQRKLHTSRLPKHLREQANEYYIEKQREFYDMKPHSRVDAMLDRTKQVVSTLRRREK